MFGLAAILGFHKSRMTIARLVFAQNVTGISIQSVRGLSGLVLSSRILSKPSAKPVLKLRKYTRQRLKAMANKITIKLVGKRQRDHAINRIISAPDGYVVTIGEETRTQEQNRLLWPHIKDLQDQVPNMKIFSAEDIKLRFLHTLGAEMRFLPELEGPGMFPVGARSSNLSKSQFSGLIELIHEYGARHGVKWSEPNPYK